MTGGRLVSAIAVALVLAGCSSERYDRPAPAAIDPVPPLMPTDVPPVQEGPAVPRIEVRLQGADSTLVRARIATARRARQYNITVDQPAHLVAEKRLTPDEAMKRTNGQSQDASFRLDYIFNTSGGVVTVALEAAIVTNPGRPGEQVRAITMPAPDADALKEEISASG
ncbi:hypothetical protein V5F59_05800 [Xanthobacter autotrophicus DSM 431]|uniref:hypothetical protein n=1 Tax=Xanthobacter nonsaccharivorans TaxID=3119912 RepID=UPI00372C7643